MDQHTHALVSLVLLLVLLLLPAAGATAAESLMGRGLGGGVEAGGLRYDAMSIVSGKLTLWLSLRLDIEATSKTKRLSCSMSSGGRLVK